jgi:feruloyl esterase
MRMDRTTNAAILGRRDGPLVARRWEELRTLAMLTLFALCAPSAPAAPPVNGNAVQDDPAAACAALAAGEYAEIPGAPAHVTASRAVAATATLPAYCQVQGYVAPNTGIELRLPLQGWNGKFFHAGCTGSCGFAADSPWVRECDYPLSRGYACIISDMGHRSGASDGLWAWHDLEAKVDFGFRATHRATVAGKALTEAFYGRRPARSYFMGCSTGGRQGLVAAQRFPDDFDGIIAGAPVVSEAATAMNFIWNLQVSATPERRPVLGRRELELVHAAVLAAADGDDGVVDGVIGDPRRVRFDPASLQCTGVRTGDCLSAEQVDAVRRIYAGPRNSAGRAPSYAGAPLPGSELGWGIFAPGPSGRAPSERSGVDTTRYMMSDWGPRWDYRDFDWDRDPARLAEMEALYSANHPDLRAFEARGGKLLVYHGWADPIVTPLGSVDYYEITERAMGGRERTQAFFRLFMVPGMKHCFAGTGPFAIDYIAALEAWVEQGRAPDALLGAHVAGNHDGPSMIRRLPVDGEVRFTRPIPPYPREYRHSGRGDPASADSYRIVAPERATR